MDRECFLYHAHIVRGICRELDVMAEERMGME